jgi:hypothetical protein
MPPFLYRGPNTGDNVQAWVADDPEDDDLTYVQVTCLACARAHLVNPKSGKVLGTADDEQIRRGSARSLDASGLGPSPGFTPSF